jgi:hypothetical protein
MPRVLVADIVLDSGDQRKRRKNWLAMQSSKTLCCAILWLIWRVLVNDCRVVRRGLRGFPETSPASPVRS